MDGHEGTMMLARDKKEGNLYVTKNKRDVITKVADRSKGSKLQWRKIRRKGEEGTKILHGEEKLEGLKSCDVDFFKVWSFGIKMRKLSCDRRILKENALV